MTHLSRKKVPDETNKALKKALFYLFTNLKKPQVPKILSSLLTDTEQKMLLKRLGILYLLNEGESQPGIANALKTTRQTVARIQLQLKAGSKESQKTLLAKLTKWGNIKFFEKVLKKAALFVIKNYLGVTVKKA